MEQESSAKWLKANISEEQIFNQFADWLETGAFAKKDILDEITHHIELFDLTFVRAFCEHTYEWSAKVGYLDHREWNRDYEQYERELSRYNNYSPESQRRQRRPKSPNKDDYYSWENRSGVWDDQFDFTIPAFGENETGGNSKLYKIASKANPSVWEHWAEADPLQVGELNTFDANVIVSNQSEIGNKRAKKAIKKIVGQIGDKSRLHDFSIRHDSRAVHLLQTQFYTIDYTYKDKKYFYISDGITGQWNGGAKPKDTDKVFKIFAVAASSVLVAFAGWLIFGSVSSDSVENTETVTSDSIFASESPTFDDATKASGLSPEIASGISDVEDESFVEDENAEYANGDGYPDVTGVNRPTNYVLAKAMGDRSRWVTPNDYPSMMLRQRKQGTTTVRLLIRPNGRPYDCSIVISSGHKELDDATCSAIRRRARFEHLDETAANIQQYHDETVRWQLPQESSEENTSPLSKGSDVQLRSNQDPPRYKPEPRSDQEPPRYKPEPRSNPATWVDSSKYPSQANRRGVSGVVRYQLTVDDRGLPQNCKIMTSSGDSNLDKVTCSLIQDSARFLPAQDLRYKNQPGTFDGEVRWKVPQ